jgi:hypothetical protein
MRRLLTLVGGRDEADHQHPGQLNDLLSAPKIRHLWFLKQRDESFCFCFSWRIAMYFRKSNRSTNVLQDLTEVSNADA